jgi:hypothetical protein
MMRRWRTDFTRLRRSRPRISARGGAIQSDAALRQSTEGRQMTAATLGVGVLLAILEAAPEIRVPFRIDSHHSSKLGGKSQGGRRDRNQPYAKVRSVSASLWIAPSPRSWSAHRFTRSDGTDISSSRPRPDIATLRPPVSVQLIPRPVRDRGRTVRWIWVATWTLCNAAGTTGTLI